jgi:isocitrate lyase
VKPRAESGGGAFAEAIPHGSRKTAGPQLFAFFPLEEELDDATIAHFQQELGAMGYKFQFVTWRVSMRSTWYVSLARKYAVAGCLPMQACRAGVRVSRELGYSAVRHQRFVGWYFDGVRRCFGRSGSTAALEGSTENEQFTTFSNGERALV